MNLSFSYDLKKIANPSVYLMLVVLTLNAPSATAHQTTLTEAYQRVHQSVVVIRTKKSGPSRRKVGQTSTSRGIGTGFVVSAQGLVITAAHVVELADAVIVQLADDRLISARVVASSTAADVALIQLDDVPADLAVARLGDSDTVSTGESIFVIGTPYGLDYTLSAGHISGRRHPERSDPMAAPVEFLQTDAAINKGNSGGPMFTLDGEVVGVVSYIQSQSGGYEGLGFATAINTAKALLLDRKSFWSGVDFVVIEAPLSEALNVPQAMGLLVQRVAKNSPGERLGLRGSRLPVEIGGEPIFLGGDIILQIDAIPLIASSELRRRLIQHFTDMPAGADFHVKVLRSGQIVTLSGKR